VRLRVTDAAVDALQLGRIRWSHPSPYSLSGIRPAFGST
jgi:hypothetical protein